jgi:drug/metabolite transporter (DMT)-like permease
MPSSAQGRAVALMLSALACLILLDTSGKWLGMRGVPVAATTWSRYFGHLLVVLAVFMPARGLSILKTAHPLRQGMRGLLMVTITMLYFAALKTMPLAQGAAVFFTTPILVTVFATLFLGERPGWQTWAAVALGFAGVLVIIRPGSDLPLAGSLLVLAAAAGNAAYQTLTRAQAHADSPEVQVLYSGLVGAAIMTLAAPLWWTPGWWEIPGMRAFDWTVFGLIGVLGAAGHLLLARAYQLASASRLSPWTYLQMLLSIPIGWVAFGNLPDAIALLGMVMIAISPNLTLLRRRRATESAA